ncbi:unnamed protein product [Cochlearia groenlandica]
MLSVQHPHSPSWKKLAERWLNAWVVAAVSLVPSYVSLLPTIITSSLCSCGCGSIPILRCIPRRPRQYLATCSSTCGTHHTVSSVMTVALIAKWCSIRRPQPPLSL